jgi:hypothetical protein
MTRLGKIFSILLALAAIFVGVLLIKARRPEPLILAELRLKGYETNSHQTVEAVLELKNPGPRPVDYYQYQESAGKILGIPVSGSLDGYATNILRVTLSNTPTRLNLSCSSRHGLRDLAHEILGLVGKRPATSGEYALFYDLKQ